MLIDGLQCGFFTREIFEDIRRGGIFCVTPTFGFWEGTLESLDSIGRWRDMARDMEDLIILARDVSDIEAARDMGKVAVLPGFQNTNCLEGRIRYVELFADLGIRVMQLTYNNQNELGGSCYEARDAGLARFGAEVVREMNRCGILVDLSHVGAQTTLDAIRVSERPVAVTHANAYSLHAHKRNKSDDVLAALREKGGIIGCATSRNIAPDRSCDSPEGFAEIVARTVDLAGIDHVGVGTDYGHHRSQEYLNWMRMGRWTRTVQYGAGSKQHPGPREKPEWLKQISGLGALVPALKTVGFNAEEIARITHGNWLRVYGAVMG